MPTPLGFVRRLSALQRVVPPEAARPVAFALLRRVAARVAPTLKMPHYRRKVPSAAQGILEGITQFLAKQPLEEAAYYLSCVYAVLCEPQRRRELAMYFTPPALARHVVTTVSEQTALFTKLRFMDPASGGAAFLLPIVVKLRNLLRARRLSASFIVRTINRQVVGIEKDPVLAELARQFIRLALAEELTACRSKLTQIVRVGDALHLFAKGRLPKVDVLLCNPPYRKIGARELAWYRRHFTDVIVGQPNLYTMFMRAATDLVAPGGLIALLTPTSYFSGPTYKRIRARYVHRCSIVRVDLIHERDNLFLNVEHDVAALLARSRASRPAFQNPEVFGWNEVEGWTALGSVVLPGDGAPWHLPRDTSTRAALIKSRDAGWSLERYGYRVRVGTYVWNRDKRRPRKARPKGRERVLAVPVVWATHIGQDGKFRFVSRSYKEQRARYILLRRGERRGVIERDCVVVQRTSSRAQSRRLVAAALPRGFAKKYGGFVGENHTIILEPTSARPLVPRRTVARLLNSSFVRDLYSTTTGTTAVTKAGLTALPLPDPHGLKNLVSRHRLVLEEAIRTRYGMPRSRLRRGISDAKNTAT